MEDKVNGGATLWARKTIDSDIFFDKPDKWFKIWFYIVNKVNHKDNKRFKRGENYFRYDWIMNGTKSTRSQVKHCIEYLKEQSMIKTHKKTHGFLIQVLKYNTYQSLDTYKSHTERNTEGTQKEHRSPNIYNNDNNDKNKESINVGISLSQLFSKDCLEYKISLYLQNKIMENNPAFKERTDPQLQKWCKEIDRLIRLDKAKPADIKKIIDWVYQDSFWNSNILSAGGLRKHYPQLWKKVIDKDSRMGVSLQDKIKNDRRLD
jgi:uncharacterized protein YlaN (UPF0358 family)